MTAESEPRRRRRKPYSPLTPPSLSMSELVKTTLDHDSTDTLIDKWLEHRSGAQDAYYEWFMDVRDRRGAIQGRGIRRKQIVAWNKGDFVPENIFCRTVDTGRLIPLDRTWTTHVYHHRSMSDRRLSMMPVVFTMLPELMILRGMHDIGCDEIYVIVTDLKRQEMNDVTDYFTLVCQYTSEGKHKPKIEEQIKYQHMRLSHTINHQRRTPCFPQIDLTLRAILHQKRPRFIVLFSHQTSSYSQIFFTDPSYVPDEAIFYDYPTGCPNPYCTDDCEMIRFPRRGLADAAVLNIRKDRDGKKRRPKRRQMCNWIDCETAFGEAAGSGCGSSEGSVDTASVGEDVPIAGQVCSKCRMVQYCTAEHQRKDWDEHKRVCVKIEAEPEAEAGPDGEI